MLDSEKENIIENTKNFTPYGTDSEKDKMVKSDYWRNRFTIAEEGYGLDVLISDEDWSVRAAVARQGYSLDILINDEHRFVREAVLYYLKKNNLTLGEWYIQNNKEINLKKLAYSPYTETRIAAIKSGYVYKENEIYTAPDCKFTPYGTNTKKDKMVKSNYWEARLKMAKEGYGLDVLINDESWGVRAKVAKQGYGLDVLINDEDYDVREAALDYLKENNLTLTEWYNQNNKDNNLRKLAFSPYPEARIAAIESGYVYKESEMYIAPECKFTPYGTNPEKDKMVKSYYPKDRLEMAEEGYGLDILINDEDWKVRRTVAEQGYGLDILVNDKDWYIREVVANQGYGLDILVNDKHGCVRIAVANQGYGLDTLINDKDWYVRRAVKNYLTAHNLTLEQWKSNQDLSKTNIINQAKNAINDGKIDIKNVADNIKSTKSVLNDSINKINKTNEIELFKLD